MLKHNLRLRFSQPCEESRDEVLSLPIPPPKIFIDGRIQRIEKNGKTVIVYAVCLICHFVPCFIPRLTRTYGDDGSWRLLPFQNALGVGSGLNDIGCRSAARQVAIFHTKPYLGLNSSPRLSILAALRFLPAKLPSIELEGPAYDLVNTPTWWFD